MVETSEKFIIDYLLSTNRGEIVKKMTVIPISSK